MKHFRILLCFLLVGCGFVPSESKLVGTWQIDVLPARKVFYVFRQDHTYAVITPGRRGGRFRN